MGSFEDSGLQIYYSELHSYFVVRKISSLLVHTSSISSKPTLLQV